MNISNQPHSPLGASKKNSQGNNRLSEDLTVILLRGNGSPRTFRLSLPALQRSLTALGFLFAFALLSALGLLGLQLLRPASFQRVVTLPAPVAPAPNPDSAPSPPPSAEAKPSNFWKSLTGSNGHATEEEMRKENEALREEVSRLSGQVDGRKELAPGQLPGLMQFFGPRNVEGGISPLAVKNIRVSRGGEQMKELFVDFELHNVDPEQKTARGYIVVLAKSQNLIASYPEGAFNPTQNIVLDYTKGETYGVSRFREARAVFRAAPLEGQRPRFQILLFASDGRVINNLHVENTGGG